MAPVCTFQSQSASDWSVDLISVMNLAPMVWTKRSVSVTWWEHNGGCRNSSGQLCAQKDGECRKVSLERMANLSQLWGNIPSHPAPSHQKKRFPLHHTGLTSRRRVCACVQTRGFGISASNALLITTYLWICVCALDGCELRTCV